VFAHSGVHAPNNNSNFSQVETKLFDTWEKMAARRIGGRVDVVLKTDATNEIRACVKQEYAGYAGVLPRCQATGRFQSAEHSLVYNGKSQDFDFESDGPEKRARGRILTPYAKHMIREAAAVLEDVYGKKVAFITLTVPGGTREALDTVALHSRSLQNTFLQNFRDRAATDLDYVGVWEWQKRGALHIHMAIAVTDSAEYAYIKKHHRKWWYRALKRLSEKTGVDLFERKDGGSWAGQGHRIRTECARVKKSVGRYMSKYLSKCSKGDDQEEWVPPGRWWFLSKPLYEKLKGYRFVETYHADSFEHAWQMVAPALDAGLKHASNYFEWRNPISGELKGLIMYFDAQVKTHAYLEIADAVEDAPHPHDRRRLWRNEETGEITSDVNSIKLGELIMWYEALDISQDGYAAFVAPFSS
jgi:hypothetical protein